MVYPLIPPLFHPLQCHNQDKMQSETLQVVTRRVVVATVVGMCSVQYINSNLIHTNTYNRPVTWEYIMKEGDVASLPIVFLFRTPIFIIIASTTFISLMEISISSISTSVSSRSLPFPPSQPRCQAALLLDNQFLCKLACSVY